MTMFPTKKIGSPPLPNSICKTIPSATNRRLNFQPILTDPFWLSQVSYRKRTPGRLPHFNSTIRTDGAPEEETVAFAAIASGFNGFRLDRFRLNHISENSNWIGLIRASS